MHGQYAPHKPMVGLAVSPGAMGTWANTSQHVHGPPGRHDHLDVPRRRPTSGTTRSRQSRAAQPARYHVARGWRGPHPHQTAVARKVGSWGIQQDTPAPVDPPRSIPTHETPSEGVPRFWQKLGQNPAPSAGVECDARPLRTSQTNGWACSVPRGHGHMGRPFPTRVRPSWPTQPPRRAMEEANFRHG